jgi:hypothetical protein
MSRSFKRITANARELQKSTIGNFSGVDLSSPTLQANNSRSVELLNFVKRQKFNQKRFGIHQVMSRLVTNDYSKINGIWSYIDSNNSERLIAHVNDNFVTLTGLGSDSSYYNVDESTFDFQFPISMPLEEGEIPFGFAADGYLYVLGGGKYLRFKYVDFFNPVVVEDLTDNLNSTYIPLTRNSVVPTGSPVEGLSQAYDDVNMLTQWKKNALITGTFNADLTKNPFHSNGYVEFKLDSKISYKNFSDLNNIKLNLSYLQTNSGILENPLWTNAQQWTSNIIELQPGLMPLSFIPPTFNDFVFKQNAYRSSNPGRDFGIYDMAVRLRYNTVTTNYQNTTETITPYFKTNGSGGIILTNISDPAVYTPSAATSYKYVIDYRPAISAGHLITTSNPDILQVTALAESQRYFEVPVKLFLRFSSSGADYDYNLSQTVKVPVQTSAEFLSFQTKYDIVATASDITTTQMNLREGSNVIGVLYYGNDNEVAKLHLSYRNGAEFENPVLGTPNAELLFPTWVSGYSQRITNCKFGKVWGYNGARNRLFISGNQGYKNIIYHTTQVNFYTKLNSDERADLQNDYTYFSDLSYNIIGTDNTAIKALEVLASGNLLVLKEESSLEPSLYTLKASLTNALAFDGSSVRAPDGTIFQEELFIANVGNQGHGGINYLSVANLGGDTLFLSQVGVRSFLLAENLPIEETRSLPASTLIDNKLLQDKNHFDKAVMTSFNGYIYLAINGTIYVASEEHRAQDVGPKEFEWWILRGKEYLDGQVKKYENINVRNFFVYDNELYIYNEYGLFKFKENSFIDKQTQFFNDGNIGYDYSIFDSDGDSTLSVIFGNDTVLNNLSLNKAITFKYGAYHAISAVTVNTQTNRITFLSHPTLSQQEIYNGREITFTNGSFSWAGQSFILHNVEGFTAQLKTPSGFLVNSWDNFTVSPLPFNIAAVYLEPGKELKIATINNATREFTVKGDFDIVVRFTYITRPIPPQIPPNRAFYIIEDNNVVSYFVTAPFNFGENTYIKTIERFVLTNDTRIDSYIEILYMASNSSEVFKAVTNSSNVLNFSNLEMDNLYFGSAYLPLPFSLRANVRNISSIMFKFYNDKDNNACLTNLTMLYYITKKVR